MSRPKGGGRTERPSTSFSFNEDVVRLCTRLRSTFLDTHKALLLTGVSSQDPVGSVAIEIAQTLMLLGEGPVLLVDANFSDPQLNERIVWVSAGTDSRVTQGVGLAEVIRQEASLADAVLADEKPGLFYLRTGAAGDNYYSLLLSEPCGELLKEMRQDYAWVLIESAPIMSHSECLRLAGQVDGVAIVLRAGVYRQAELVELQQAIKGFQLPFVGAILCSPKGK